MKQFGFEMQGTMPATWKAVERFLRRFRNRVRDGTRENDFATELLLREALNNAVVHGCACDPAKRVSCRIRMDSRRVIFSVRDDGIGFDWRSRLGREAPPEAESGRGIVIFRRFAQRVRFNAAGNAVTMIRRW